MKKTEVQTLYSEVKRRKVAQSKRNGLIEPRPAKKCNCGLKAKRFG